MQGKKEYAEKLFLNFRLSERMPKENFYRQLKETLNLSHLGKLTEKQYGKEDRKSIDTEVLFKFMLIGYLENIYQSFCMRCNNAILNYKTLYNMQLKNRKWELCNENYMFVQTANI